MIQQRILSIFLKWFFCEIEIHSISALKILKFHFGKPIGLGFLRFFFLSNQKFSHFTIKIVWPIDNFNFTVWNSLIAVYSSFLCSIDLRAIGLNSCSILAALQKMKTAREGWDIKSRRIRTGAMLKCQWNVLLKTCSETRRRRIRSFLNVASKSKCNSQLQEQEVQSG